MLNICLNSKRNRITGRIFAAVATERIERMDIFCGQNTESFKNYLKTW